MESAYTRFVSVTASHTECQTGVRGKYQVKNTVLAQTLTVYSLAVFPKKIYPGILESWTETQIFSTNLK